jgi:hypothetical protein
MLPRRNFWYLESPSWIAIPRNLNLTPPYVDERGFLIRSKFIAKAWLVDRQLPPEAVRWISSVRTRAARIRKRNKEKGFSYEYYMTGCASGAFIYNVNGRVWEVDVRNAYLHVAQALGYVTQRQVVAAYRIRRKYGIKPAMMLGMALGGWIHRVEVEPDGRTRRDVVYRAGKDFLLIAHTTFEVMRRLAVDTGAIAYYVDALLYEKIPDTKALADRLAAMLGISRIWAGFSLRELSIVRVSVTPLGVRYLLSMPDGQKTWVLRAAGVLRTAVMPKGP